MIPGIVNILKYFHHPDRLGINDNVYQNCAAAGGQSLCCGNKGLYVLNPQSLLPLLPCHASTVGMFINKYKDLYHNPLTCNTRIRDSQ